MEKNDNIDNIIEGSRFTEHPIVPNISGGDPLLFDAEKDPLLLDEEGNIISREQYINAINQEDDDDSNYSISGVFSENDPIHNTPYGSEEGSLNSEGISIDTPRTRNAKKTNATDARFIQARKHGMNPDDEPSSSDNSSYNSSDISSDEYTSDEERLNLNDGEKNKSSYIHIEAINTLLKLSYIVNDAIIYWENNITPNIQKIPIIKIDSFLKSSTFLSFKKFMKDFESLDVREIYDLHLKEIKDSIDDSLKNLYSIMISDIKKYESGFYSPEDTSKFPNQPPQEFPQTLQGGFITLRSPLQHLNVESCPTKYLL
jgi:hypothetical protein